MTRPSGEGGEKERTRDRAKCRDRAVDARLQKLSRKGRVCSRMRVEKTREPRLRVFQDAHVRHQLSKQSDEDLGIHLSVGNDPGRQVSVKLGLSLVNVIIS